METNNFEESSNIAPPQEEQMPTADIISDQEPQYSNPATPERPQATETSNLPAFFCPLDGQTFDDALDVLEPQFELGEEPPESDIIPGPEFEDEEDPSESEIIPGPEWPALDEPTEEVDGCYLGVQDTGFSTEDVQGVGARAEVDPVSFRDRASTAFKAAMVVRNLIPPTSLQADGDAHRCDVAGPGGEGDGSYKFSLDGIPDGGFQNHKDGCGWEAWAFEFGPGELISPEKLNELKKSAEVLRKAREAEEAEARRKAQEVAQAIWFRSLPCTEHPYLTKKGVKPLGARLVSSGFLKGNLVLPIRDSKGEIHSLQFIDGDGGKHFLKHGRKKGCCFPIGQPKGMLFIAEGFATAATIHEATGEAVLVAFDCGNLRPVAEALRVAFPNYPIVVAADDDYRTDGNPGLTKAIEAATSVGGRAVLPDFGSEVERPERATDFNDLHQVQGLDAVRDCIEHQLQDQASTQDPLPEIVTSGRSNYDILADAFVPLTKQERVFVRGGQLVHVSVPYVEASAKELICPTIVPATSSWMCLELSRVAAFYRVSETGKRSRTLVPDWASKLALEMTDFQGLQRLLALAETPVLLKDGSIHDTPGFDPSTGMYYVPIGNSLTVPESPTIDDARTAAGELFDLVSDFPFANDASRAGWLALLLTVPARFGIPGPVPFWLIDANGQSAGKGLLTSLTSIITLGRNPVAMVGSRDPEEFRKNLLCTLMNGTRMAWLDEAESPFGGRQWNGLITANHFQDRILGASKTWSGPHFTTWVVTGNNVQLTTDTPRRCVHVRLEPSEERPEERGGFKIADILAHARKHQTELFNHLLVILRAYHLAGKPRHDLKPWGSFEDWSNLIRECVYWCTGIDCDTRRELTATADPTRGMAGVLLEHLERLFPRGQMFLASEALSAYETKDMHGHWTNPEFREALDTLKTNPRDLNAKSLGNLLKTRRDRNFSGLVLKGNAGGKHGMAYRVIRVSGTAPELGTPELGVPGPPPQELMMLGGAQRVINSSGGGVDGFGGPGWPGIAGGSGGGAEGAGLPSFLMHGEDSL